MVERVRTPGSNVTDATLAEAIGACVATYRQVQETAEEAKTARSEHSNELKRWKKNGVNIEALKTHLKERFEDPEDILARVHQECRMRALSGKMPTVQQDLMELWKPIDIEADKQHEINMQRIEDEGSFAAAQGEARDVNRFAPGSAEHQAWDRGWLNNEPRIAKEMEDGKDPQPKEPPASRKRPERKTKPKDEPEVEAAKQRAAENGGEGASP